MKKTLIAMFLILLISALPANAEGLYDFVDFSRPFVTGSIDFADITVDMAESFSNSLTGFTCKRTNFSDKRTRFECSSDNKKFSGSYKLFFSYDSEKRLQFFEVQASHPDLDDFLSQSSYGLRYWAKVLWEKVKHKSYIESLDYVLYAEGYSDHVFSSKISGIANCSKVNDKCVMCIAYKEKESSSERNKYILSVSDITWFSKENSAD